MSGLFKIRERRIFGEVLMQAFSVIGLDLYGDFSKGTCFNTGVRAFQIFRRKSLLAEKRLDPASFSQGCGKGLHSVRNRKLEGNVSNLPAPA
jgi:hypothetical protein